MTDDDDSELVALVARVLWDPKARRLVAWDAAPPRLLWLAVSKVVGVSDGNGKGLDLTTVVPLLISRHAAIRIAMRTNVRTVDELIASIGDLAQMLATLMRLRPDDWFAPPASGWLLPITSPGQSGPSSYAVLERDREGGRRLVVKTILAPEMLSDADLAPTLKALKKG